MKGFTMKKAVYLIAVFALMASLAACEKKGTLEQLGSDADKAMQKTADAVNDATN
jgi:predicted small lipoprotein YifL